MGLMVLRATAFPIAIYGCESWAMTSADRKRVDASEVWCLVIEDCLGCHGRRGKRTNGCWRRLGLIDVEKEYVEEEDEVLWTHRPEERYGEKTDARKDGRQAEKGQTSNDLVPRFERMDQAGHCWCITTGDRSGKMAKNHQSHSSADSAT